MNLLAHIAKAACKHQFHLRVYILHTFFDDESALHTLVVDVLKFGEKLSQFVFLHQSDRLQHSDVSHRAKHIILGEVDVKFAVASHSETLYLFVDREVFFPKFACHNYKVRMRVCQKYENVLDTPSYLLVILNHLQNIGNLLDAFLQWFLHHLLDEDI